MEIRNQQHLFESLDAFVKGDLLEGANAYHCEKCDKKVDTVKRLCIKKLPKVLVLQLKRFDYDWERYVIPPPPSPTVCECVDGIVQGDCCQV